jgi:hypothetical protein
MVIICVLLKSDITKQGFHGNPDTEAQSSASAAVETEIALHVAVDECNSEAQRHPSWAPVALLHVGNNIGSTASVSTTSSSCEDLSMQVTKVHYYLDARASGPAAGYGSDGPTNSNPSSKTQHKDNNNGKEVRTGSSVLFASAVTRYAAADSKPSSLKRKLPAVVNWKSSPTTCKKLKVSNNDLGPCDIIILSKIAYYKVLHPEVAKNGGLTEETTLLCFKGLSDCLERAAAVAGRQKGDFWKSLDGVHEVRLHLSARVQALFPSSTEKKQTKSTSSSSSKNSTSNKVSKDDAAQQQREAMLARSMDIVLFQQADTLQKYMDGTTLQERVTRLAYRMLLKHHNQNWKRSMGIIEESGNSGDDDDIAPSGRTKKISWNNHVAMIRVCGTD